MIEVRTLHTESGEALAELKLPVGESEDRWQACGSAYEGFSYSKFKKFEIDEELEQSFAQFIQKTDGVAPSDSSKFVAWYMTLWIRFLSMMGMR